MSCYCDKCWKPMAGIINKRIRSMCHDCGGSSLADEDHKSLKLHALENCKEAGEISRSYQFMGCVP